jgi:hypothetical protein
MPKGTKPVPPSVRAMIASRSKRRANDDGFRFAQPILRDLNCRVG